MTSPIHAKINKSMVAKNMPFLIVLLYSSLFKFSVIDNKMGLIPNGFISANKEENEIIKNDILIVSIFYMLSGAEIPKIFSPFLITIFVALINTTLALLSSIFSVIILL